MNDAINKTTDHSAPRLIQLSREELQQLQGGTEVVSLGISADATYAPIAFRKRIDKTSPLLARSL